MFKNYLTIAFRNLLKNKIFSMVNILGLAIGMAACFFVFLYVNSIPINVSDALRDVRHKLQITQPLLLFMCRFVVIIPFAQETSEERSDPEVYLFQVKFTC